jgi:hypothetical protein
MKVSAFPEILTLVFLVMGLAGLAFLIYDTIKDKAPGFVRKRRMVPFIGMIVLGLGWVRCAAWYFWPQEMPVITGEEREADGSGRPKNDHDAQHNPASNRTEQAMTESEQKKPFAYFECAPWRWSEAESEAKPIRQIFIMQFDKPTVGFTEQKITADQHNKKFSSYSPLKCALTFYNDKYLVNPKVPLVVSLYEVIQSPGRNQSGKLMEEITTHLDINQVIPPGNTKVEFLVYSFDVNAFILVKSAGQFDFSYSGSPQRLNGNIISTDSQLSMLMAGPDPNAKKK